MLTGVFIAGYTINDGWAVKVLMLSPFVIDFTGNLLRLAVLAPMALRDRAELDGRGQNISNADPHRRRARAARLHPGVVSR